jgi:hypothetical protein
VSIQVPSLAFLRCALQRVLILSFFSSPSSTFPMAVLPRLACGRGGCQRRRQVHAREAHGR